MNTPAVGSYIREQFETVPAQDMESLQMERLRAGVARLSQTVPFYRHRLREAGVYADRMRCRADLARLPFTTKDDLRDQYPFGLLAVPMLEVIRVHASSGTTGKPTVVAYTRHDIELWSELMARTYAAAGVTAADLVHNAYGYGLFTGGLGFHYGAEHLGATVIPVSGGNTMRQRLLLRDLGSTALCCTPSYALLLAEVAEGEALDLPALPLKVGIFGAEPWSERMRTAIEARLGLLALNVYGLSEVIGPGGRDGVHGTAGDAHLRGSLHPGDYRPRHDRTLARWRRGRTRPDLRHQRGPALAPLPHARPDASHA
jgi:phenylacetate-CoA ligase